MIGEYEWAFYASQYASVAPLFEHHGVGLWMPEVGGRVDWHAEDHEQTMLALGLSSQRMITHRHGRPDQEAGPLSGRPPAVRVPTRRRRAHLNKAHAAWDGGRTERAISGRRCAHYRLRITAETFSQGFGFSADSNETLVAIHPAASGIPPRR